MRWSTDAVARPRLSVCSERDIAFSRDIHAPINRFMSLNDLMTEIKTDPNSFLGDETTENKVLRQVLLLVEDKISEVKNQAVKWCVLKLKSSRGLVLTSGVVWGS